MAHISAHTQNIQISFKYFVYRKKFGAHISAYLEMLVLFHAIPRGAHLGACQKLKIAALNIEFPRQLGTDTVSVGTDWDPQGMMVTEISIFRVYIYIYIYIYGVHTGAYPIVSSFSAGE